jgi:malonyl-CoA O-methyltransferase
MMRTALTPLPPRLAYELWADTYPAEAHNPLMAAEERIVVRILAHLSAKRALDVGTGSGRYLPILATRADSVVGLDLSMAMLMHVVHGRCIRADACRLPFRRATFDLVNASLMVGDVSDLGGWMTEMARVMTPGGHLVYSDFHPSWVDHGWERTFRTADGGLHAVQLAPHTIEAHLAALSDAGLSVLAIREPHVTLPEGGRLARFARAGAWARSQTRRPRWRASAGDAPRAGMAPVVAVFHAVKTAPRVATPEQGSPR